MAISKKSINLLITALLIAYASFAQQNNLFNIKDYGAVGDSSTYEQSAIQKAIDVCFEAGGGRVYFPPGKYTTGTIVLKSNVDLHLEAGAILQASRDTNHYKNDFIIYKKNDSGKTGDGATPVLIYANNAENISITGKGKIHGQASRTYEDLRSVDGFIAEETENARQSGVEMKMYYKIPPYTCMVFLEECKFVTIRDVSMIESTDWTLHFKWCENVFVEGVYIFSSLEQGVNADGIDVDGSKNVTISNCIIETGDDAIVLKTTQTFGEARPCENVTVTNCVLSSTSTGLKLGTESFADFRFITFNNCVIRDSNRGLSIVIRDGATAENILFSDITLNCDRKHFNWWGNGDPIWLVVKKRSADSKIGHIKNVTFRNIQAVGQGTSKLEGFPGHPISNIKLSQVSLTMEAEDKPDKRATHAFEAQNVTGLQLDDVQVNWDDSKGIEKDWQYNLHFKDVTQLYIRNFMGAPIQDNTLVHLENVQDAFLNNLFGALPNKNPFVSISGKNSKRISVDDINEDAPENAISAGAEVDESEVDY